MSNSSSSNFFDKVAGRITAWTGSSLAFSIALMIVIIWAICGPIFNYSETWQLVINTGTTIITFLMVFIIQKSQNKDSKALQLKLNELIAASKHASNRMVDIEELTEDELNRLRAFYKELARLSDIESNIHSSHSIDAARKWHKEKMNHKNDADKPENNNNSER